MARLKVLVVEDDKHLRRIYDAGLYDAVFEKAFAENGTEALERYSSFQPELIVLDIMLPELSGYLVLKTIREDLNDKTTPIIMSTSLSDKTTVVDCLKLGIQGYLVKPFTHRDVGEKVLEYYCRANPEKGEPLVTEYEQARSAKAEPETGEAS